MVFMSKIRQDVPRTDSGLSAREEPDLRGYVILTQLKKGGPFVYAGWLDAPDDEMAMILAKEHYGQDQKCEAIWAAPREFIGGLRENMDAAEEPVDESRPYQIFVQPNAGDQHESSVEVTATSASAGLDQARRTIDGAMDMHNLWAIPKSEIIATKPGELIWRHTDQTYRLARGYSKDVREKWQKIRAERDIKAYERDDLQDTF